jgi:glycosyltransferase involved in cell wall biosynthesis
VVRVTVIIPTYNYGHFLGEAIQSVLDQTFKDFELIVVDDGSTDNTREVVEKFNDTRIRYIYKDHIGVSAAQNAALRAARGEYITGLSADDLYLPQNLEIKVKLLDSRLDVDLVYSNAYIFNNRTGATIGKLWRYPKGLHLRFDPERAARQPLKELLYRGFFIMLQATMMRRQVFDEVGNFDESLLTHEDWDLIIRVVQRFPIELIDVPLLKLRRHDTNLSKDEEKMYQGAVAAINKAMHSGSFSIEELKLIKKSLVPQHISYGRWALLDGKEAAARTALIAGIRLEPWNIKPYIYLGLSILGTRKVLALRSWKKVIGRHLVRSLPSGGACHDGSKLLSK